MPESELSRRCAGNGMKSRLRSALQTAASASARRSCSPYCRRPRLGGDGRSRPTSPATFTLLRSPFGPSTSLSFCFMMHGENGERRWAANRGATNARCNCASSAASKERGKPRKKRACGRQSRKRGMDSASRLCDRQGSVGSERRISHHNIATLC
jgi:hypothetical protein